MLWFKKKTTPVKNTPAKDSQIKNPPVETSQIKTSAQMISFELFDPEANSVFLCGDFNSWETKATPLIQDDTGRWKTSISLRPGRYEYRFFVDGQWRNDQRPVCLVDNEFGSQNCVIETV